jgi:hypothetical protein
MTRRVVHKQSRASQARQDKAKKLQRKAMELAASLARVERQIADQRVPRRPNAQHASASSSIPTVRIQPGAQSVIPLQGEGDHSHQIMLSYREPEGSGRTPAQNTSSVPVHTCLVDALAIGASLEEFSETVVNSTYQFLLRTNTLRAHTSDMGRIALMSAHLRRRGVSTPTVLIHKLADALQVTVEHVLQSQDTFDINSPLQLEFQLQLSDSRGNGSIRFYRLEVGNFIRGGALGFLDPELGFGEGLCMLMSVVMATVRSVQPSKGSVIYLPFLPISFTPDPAFDRGDITQLCQRVEDAEGPDDFAHSYQGFASICYMIWARIRTQYLSFDASLAPAFLPSMITQKHLEFVALYLGVCIHVLCYEAMGKETMRYGNKRGMLHLYIYKQDAHYHPVYRVHNLPATKGCYRVASNWCDFCCKTVGTSGDVGKSHLLKCSQKACESPATTLEREFMAKWASKHQPAFRFPPRTRIRQDRFCVVCNQFMDGLTHNDVEHVPQEEEGDGEERKEGDEEEAAQQQQQQQMQTDQDSDACPMCGFTLHTLYITHCTICNVKVPLGDTRKGMLKYEFHNRHRCFCGTRKSF